MKTTSIWVWLGGMLMALCAVSSAQTPKKAITVDDAVAAWLKLWGEDVSYSVSNDREHEACKALLALGPAAVPALVRTLRQSTNESSFDGWRRDNAACVLDQMGPAAKLAVPDLIALLGAENSGIRCWVAQILGSIGSDAGAAVPELIRSLHGKPLVRGEAAIALGRIGAEAGRVVPELTRLLQDQDSEVQRRATVALGKFGPKATGAAQHLYPLLQAPDISLRETAAWALGQIEPGQTNVIQEQLQAAAEADRARANALFRNDPGLSCRAVPATNCIEQGMPLQIRFETRAAPEELPPGVKHLNAFLIIEQLSLHLTNRTTGQVLALDIEESAGPGFTGDEGQQAQLLDGRKLGPWEAWFRLVRLRATLEPGTYECAVELACPNTKPKNWWVEKAPDWRSFGFWSGRIFSPSFELKVVAGTLKRQKIVVHGEPHLEKGKDGNFRLVFKKEEFSTVEVETRNGFFVGREGIFPDGRSALQSGAATDKPDQDWVLDIPARVKWPKYRAAIFETVKPPAHFWQPYASDDGYKVLWEVSFKTNLLSKADSMLTSPH